MLFKSKKDLNLLRYYMYFKSKKDLNYDSCMDLIILGAMRLVHSDLHSFSLTGFVYIVVLLVLTVIPFTNCDIWIIAAVGLLFVGLSMRYAY